MSFALNSWWIYRQLTTPAEASTPQDKPNNSGQQDTGRGKATRDTKGTKR